MHVTTLARCRVLVGPVARSVFLSDCVDCTFVVACQQVNPTSD